jgi:hypothetical protein
MVDNSPVPKIPMLLFGSVVYPEPHLSSKIICNKTKTENSLKARELLALTKPLSDNLEVADVQLMTEELDCFKTAYPQMSFIEVKPSLVGDPS